MHGWRAAWIVVPALATLAGCSEDPGPPEIFVTLAAKWDYRPADRQAFGYTLTTTLKQWRRDQASCDPPPAPVRFTIDGAELEQPTPDPLTGCIDFSVADGPTLEVGEAVTVRYEMNGQLLATATF